MEITIKITTQLTLHDFKRYNFYALYRNKSIWVLTFIGCLMMLTSFIALLEAPLKDILTTVILSSILIGFAPLMIVLFAKRNFSSNKELSEAIVYEFDEQFVSSFSAYGQTKTPWRNLFRVRVSKNWLILYRSRQTANIIPMRYLTQAQIDSIKQFVLSNNIKANFKK